MNNVNSIHSIDFGHTKSDKWKNWGYAFILASLLNVSTPAIAQTSTSTTRGKASTEQVDSPEHSGFNLPKTYKDKIYDMIANNPIFVDDGYNDAKMFTIEFVLEEMSYDRGISKDNQLLGIWHSIYQQCTGKDLYDGEDGDEKRLEEFEIAIDSIDACGEKFKNSFVSHNNKSFAEATQKSADYDRRLAEATQKSADYDRRLAEAQKRIDAALKQSAEYRQQSAETVKKIKKSLNESLGLFKELYPLFKAHPDDERLISFKSNAKELVRLCNKYEVDYKAILSPEIRNFYEME